MKVCPVCQKFLEDPDPIKECACPQMPQNVMFGKGIPTIDAPLGAVWINTDNGTPWFYVPPGKWATLGTPDVGDRI